MVAFNFIVFPGFLFLVAYSLIFEYLDRKLYAKMQNRMGPPWYQPIADLLKLLGKETIIPIDADKKVFPVLPVFSLAAVMTASIYIPIWSTKSLAPFGGDLIVVLYLLTIPTLTFFLAGWYSSSVFATIGSVRALTQLFSYEVPLFMALLSTALIAQTWSVSGISAFYASHPQWIPINLIALLVALAACQGKLERVPFDLPEAETELAGGPFVEYSGRYFALFKLSISIELVVVVSLIAAIFLPFFTGIAVVDFILYLVKTFALLFILVLLRTVMARMRIEQMVMFCWKYLTPAALLQAVINLLMRGVFL
jgi:NADH-quinone oxidoreductase subunit H